MSNKPTIVGITPEQGSRLSRAGPMVEIVQSVREMKCYTVTDSELQGLSLANGLAILFFSLAAACLTFGIDIAKDVALTQELTPGGATLDHIIQPVSYIFAVIFCLAGVGTWIWRRNMINIIKRESTGETD